MQALRLNQVLTRVVAWHNQHPLARRITVHQVHSIGEVVLPFASALAAPLPPAPPATPGLPAMQDLLAPAAATLVDGHVPAGSDHPGAGLAVQAAPLPAPTAAAEPAVERVAGQASETNVNGGTIREPALVLSMEDEADELFGGDPPADQAMDDEGGPEMLIELSTDPDAPQHAALADSSVPAPDASVADAAPELAPADAGSAALAAAFAAATAATAVTADSPATPAGSDRVADADADIDASLPAEPEAGPAAAPAAAGLLARILTQLNAWRLGPVARRLPRLQATFSRDFIWPLRPGQVARWARRHGSLAPLAPADWPQRLIDSDASLQAQARRQGLPHQLPLHVLTAAIGVGDRRIRVLISGQGQILGPRSYSPPKLTTLASVVALGLLGAGWGWLPRGETFSAQQASAAVAAAASAAALAASAAKLAAAAASAADGMWRAAQAESMPAGTAPADQPDGHAVPAVAAAASQPAAGVAAPAAQADETLAIADDTGAAPDQASTPAQPSTAVTLGDILPVLSPTDKQAARLQTQALRIGQAAAIAAQPPKPAGPVFAVVTQATREKSSAARGLALIRASGQRLSDDAPEHRELMLQQGEWRAAWWPFESQADAERARVMLAARGLKVEVVAF